MKIADWMTQSGVMFGTSGARGLVVSMTDAVCFAYTVGYLKHLETLGEFKAGTSVAVAGDLRSSTPRILRACMAAITWMKGVPDFCGFVPTPALCTYAFTRGIPSLMVTGSHIPDDRNGIKFNRACGEFLKNDEASMREQEVVLPEGWFNQDGQLVHPFAEPAATDVVADYIARYRDFFGKDALTGLTLGVYQHSAVGRDVLVAIVEALGGKAVPLARSETFISVDTEAVRPEDVKLALEWGKLGTYDAILTTDGDSDRPLLADRHGHWLRGDVLGIVAAQALEAAAVTTPVSSNTALEMADFARSVRRTKIGSPFVVAEMMAAVEEGFVPSVGYEANGGFLLASDVSRKGRTLGALPTRDAVLPMLCALVAARHKETDLSGLLASMPPRFTLSDRLKDIPTQLSLSRLDVLRHDLPAGLEVLRLSDACGAVKHVDETDGLRLTFENGDIVHLRPSGNAPELRVYVEASTLDRAEELLKLGMDGISLWQQ